METQPPTKLDAPDDGGPAFPSHGSMGEVCQEGMTLRDWLAGQAISAHFIGLPKNLQDRQYFCQKAATDAYEVADAMLEARQR